MDVNSNSIFNRSTTLNTTSNANSLNTAAKAKTGGVLGFVEDVFVGAGSAIVDMGKGLVNTILHPIKTLKGLAYVVTHPATLFHAFVDPYMEAIKSGHPGEALGRGIVEIGSMFISPSDVVNGVSKGFNSIKSAITGAGKGAGVASSAAEAANVAAEASVVEKASDTASRVAGKVSNVAGKIADTTLGSIGKKIVDTVENAVSKGAEIVKEVPAFVKEVPGKVSTAVSHISAMTVGDILKASAEAATKAGTFAMEHPQIIMASGMVANRLQNLPEEAATSTDAVDSLTQDQATEIGQKYGLDPAKENIKRFLTEVSGYAGNYLGPDTGNATDIAQLQKLLKALGYQVNSTGTFDDSTANAIVDFKQKHGLHQTYLLPNGDYAVNEYVGQDTANAIVAAVQQQSTSIK